MPSRRLQIPGQGIVGTAAQSSYTDTNSNLGDTNNVQDALDSAGTQLSAIADILTDPVASYTHTTNAEITVSAVDLDTEIFTSVGHGLSNNDKIYPTLNSDAGALYPLQQYCGGMAQQAYYAIVVSPDTFQISASSGPGAAVDITSAGDITKWHFETHTAGVIISGLVAKTKYRVKINGKFSGSANAVFLTPTAPTTWNSPVWMRTGGTTLSTPQLIIGNANIYCNIDAIIDSTDYAKIVAVVSSFAVNAAQAAQYVATSGIYGLYSPDTSIADTNITSILIYGSATSGILNGTKIEVYDL